MQGRLREWVPRWWSGERGTAGAVLSAALAPAEALFRGAVALRNAHYDRSSARATRASIPVVSVGNLTVGGAGKTPVSAWIAERLVAQGSRPAVVSRGYAEDEQLVHRELNPGVPVFASARRAAGVAEAADAGCDVAVLDDGFQHRGLARDLDIVLIAVEDWPAKPRLLPRGPWREPLASVRRADVVVITRKSASRERARSVAAALEAVAGGVQVASCALVPTAVLRLDGNANATAEWLRGRQILAVTSIANPGSFLAQLVALGADAELVAYPDHHSFTPADVEDVLRRARDRPLIMTRKEAVKLRRLLPARCSAWLVEQRVEFEAGEDLLLQALREVVRR